MADDTPTPRLSEFYSTDEASEVLAERVGRPALEGALAWLREHEPDALASANVEFAKLDTALQAVIRSASDMNNVANALAHCAAILIACQVHDERGAFIQDFGRRLVAQLRELDRQAQITASDVAGRA